MRSSSVGDQSVSRTGVSTNYAIGLVAGDGSSESRYLFNQHIVSELATGHQLCFQTRRNRRLR